MDDKLVPRQADRNALSSFSLSLRKTQKPINSQTKKRYSDDFLRECLKFACYLEIRLVHLFVEFKVCNGLRRIR
jgi:hypothetical protein